MQVVFTIFLLIELILQGEFRINSRLVFAFYFRSAILVQYPVWIERKYLNWALINSAGRISRINHEFWQQAEFEQNLEKSVAQKIYN